MDLNRESFLELLTILYKDKTAYIHCVVRSELFYYSSFKESRWVLFVILVDAIHYHFFLNSHFVIIP